MPARSQQATLGMLGDERIKALATRYADALEQGDAASLISMLTEDATWSMPPHAIWFRGHQAIRNFLVTYPLNVRWKHVPTWANGQLAVGCYAFEPAVNEFLPAVIDVLTLDGEKISSVTAFLTDDHLRPPPTGPWIGGAKMFARFGLPDTPP
jgi:RNA polymerase sigma-70 factor (ECF subfamily)